MNNFLYKLLTPFANLCARNQKLMLSLRYWKENKRILNLSKPKLFAEKIFWLACNTDTSMWSFLADKYAVRDFVASKCGESLLSELYGVWDNPDDINYQKLPNKFVIKANNGCGSVIIVRDKDHLNIESTNKQLKYWLKLPFGDISGQLHYSHIKPKIIAEELLIQDGNPNKMLIDYKIHCFNGKPLFVSVFSDRIMYKHQVNEMLYDMDWVAHPEWYDESKSDLHESKLIDKPLCWEEMKTIAQRLSEGFKYVRVDLYVIDGKPKFGELTFTPGLDTFYSKKFEERLGDLIIID